VSYMGDHRNDSMKGHNNYKLSDKSDVA
jgi:hypothetical protein